jgi:DNA-binding transcriptional LysR family regulator
LLEDRYGAELIHRSPGQWEITDTGKELYQGALSVVADVDALEGDFTQASDTVEGPLSISVEHEFGPTSLSPVLIGFQEAHADIQLIVTFDNRPVDLAHDNFDFAIRITSALIAQVGARLIGQAKHAVYASESYLEKRGTPTTAKDLKDHRLLYCGTTKRGEWIFTETDGRTTKVAFKPAMGSNSGVFLTNAVRQGAEIVRLPDFICQPYVTRGEIVPILEHLRSAPLNIYLLHRENQRFSRRIRIFSEEIQRACNLPA